MHQKNLHSCFLSLVFPLFLGILGWSPRAEAQECVNLTDALNGIHKYLDEVMLEEARSLALQAQRQLACQAEPVNPLLLTSLYGASGAVNFFLGEEKAARSNFQLAMGANPTTALDARYGEEAGALFESVRAEVLGQPGGKLTITGNASAWVDGQPSIPDQPIQLAAGQHLLQWKSDTAVMAGRSIDIGPGENRTLHLGEPPPNQRPVYLASGGALALAGGTLLALASRKVNEFDEYEEEYNSVLESSENHSAAQEDLQSLVQKNHALAISGSVLGLAGVGLAAVAMTQSPPGSFGISLAGKW